jgi:hypothetical protein
VPSPGSTSAVTISQVASWMLLESGRRPVTRYPPSTARPSNGGWNAEAITVFVSSR